MNEEPDKLKEIFHRGTNISETLKVIWQHSLCSLWHVPYAMASTSRLLKACLCMEDKHEQSHVFEFVNQELHFTPRPRMFLHHRKATIFQKVNFGYVRLHANLWKEINFGTFFFLSDGVGWNRFCQNTCWGSGFQHSRKWTSGSNV